MIPTGKKCRELWDKYEVSEYKRKHMEIVAKVARLLATKTKSQKPKAKINIDLLFAACLLHDLDKNVPKTPGEKHPDAAVRILNDEKMGEVAKLVATHSLHNIIDSDLKPKSIEEKILFLSDKMVKDDVITVDERFRLWKDERLPLQEQTILDKSYPLVKALEDEIMTSLSITPDDIKEIVHNMS
ncbi:HD domain-containing protein [Patescibacteria group bacterium]